MNYIKDQIFKYINQLTDTNYKKMNVLLKVSSIIDSSGFNLVLDDYIEIVKSFNFIDSILATMYLENKDFIVSRGVEFISLDANIIGLFDAYFSLHDIDINIIKIDNLTSDIYSDYVKRLEKRIVLSKEQENNIIKKIQDTNNAKLRNTFVENNLSLVISIARRYVGFGLYFMDLIQEGNIGLFKAIEKFDTTKNYKFSTYAVFWIKQNILAALANNSRLIRLPVYQHYAFVKYVKFTNKFINEYGVEPTASEISKFANIPIEEVLKFRQICEPFVSINKKIYETDDCELSDILSDAYSIEDDADQIFMHEDLINVLNESNLDQRYIDILMLRFGINQKRTYTLKEIAEMYNLSRERIRQIEQRALSHLRKDKNYKKVIDYVCSEEKIKKLSKNRDNRF